MEEETAGQKGAGGAKTASPAAAIVEITYYTDPLCCWSWAFEPQWRRLRYQYAGRIRWRYRMGGLSDGGGRPAQMGPLWKEAQHVSGMPIEARIWMEDAPSSSYPSCLAVKAAERQSAEAGERMLRRLREAVMREGRNIARRAVIDAVAGELARAAPEHFDAGRFREDWDSPAVRDAFRSDLKEARYREIGRFLTLTLQQVGTPGGVVIVGYRPYEALEEALRQVAPDVEPVRAVPDVETYAAFWGGVTDRELAELGEGAPKGPARVARRRSDNEQTRDRHP